MNSSPPESSASRDRFLHLGESVHNQSVTQKNEAKCLSGALSSDTAWQTSKDIPDRLNILSCIREIVLLKIQNGASAEQARAKVPVMTRKMEEILYRAAESKEEYMNLSTLHDRLAMIARALECKKRKSNTTWQSSQDQSERLQMIIYIKRTIKKQLRDRPQDEDVAPRLSKVSKMMEAALYKSAKSKDEYLDLKTLPSRLRGVAEDVFQV